MCRRVECRKCGKPTWAGCGAHVEQVLSTVPAADRCQGHGGETKRVPDTAPTLPPLFSRLFGSRKSLRT